VLKAGLEGRISIQFVISPQGQVASSVLQSSTMSNLSVEKCVVDAVKRWEFPKPTGGGIAIVAYPFNFVAGSGG
jgi:TonB family protein